MAKKAHLKQRWVNTKLCSNKLKALFKKKTSMHLELEIDNPLNYSTFVRHKNTMEVFLFMPVPNN